MKVRRVAIAIVAVALPMLFGTTGANASDPSDCAKRDSQGFCVEWKVPGNHGTPGGGDSGGGTGGAPACYWVNKPPFTDVTVFADYGLDHPPPGVEIQWQSYECSDGSPKTNYRWVFTVPPTQTANDILVRIERGLEPPKVESSPPIGTASIVTVPMFISVANWSGVIAESGCGGGICVTVTATPVLTFDPGEPGSKAQACTASGTKFNRALPPVPQASAPGACTHTYKLRTGAEGRPNEWPATATVRWSIAFTSTVGQSGVLPAVVRSVAIPRSVQEVQTVVVGGSTQ
jgi:hypothetical protein